ncbi:hypothetical protein Pflav_002420 [Phytohabitans flavus]|uniref:RNA polymerase sigma-70 region 2 domain-containing protein n=1 Tax=Phytohabitans flavus TaxID=1076124 RepID=A0A6F8XJ44_9ACTN|nr:hypothetical protein Pflav_002420 [Phytohabitans flavus]
MISFDEFVTARGPALLRFGYLMCGDRHLAEDILQEVLAKVYRRWGRIARAEPPEAYVRRAILHQYLSWRRRRASTEAIVAEVPEHPDRGLMADQVAVRDEMWALLATLPGYNGRFSSCGTTSTCPTPRSPTWSAAPRRPCAYTRSGRSARCGRGSRRT